MVNTPSATYTVVVFHDDAHNKSGSLIVDDHEAAFPGISSALSQIGVRDARIVAIQELSEDLAVQLQITLQHIDITRISTSERLAALLEFKPVPTYPKPVRVELLRYVPFFVNYQGGLAPQYESELCTVMGLYVEHGDNPETFKSMADAALAHLEPNKQRDVLVYFQIFLHEFGGSLQEYQSKKN